MMHQRSRPFQFKRTKRFRRDYKKLSPFQQAQTAAAFKTFKKNPWDKALKTHKIESLSRSTGKPIWSVYVDEDLRALFTQKGDVIIALVIGNHDVYKKSPFPCGQ